MLSDLARQPSTGQYSAPRVASAEELTPLHDFGQLPRRGQVVSNTLIGQLRHEESG
jgi:hypothetical protein